MVTTSILSVIILLSVLIFAHELGHFLAARFLGVGVLKFSLGFGPKLIGKKWGETEYLISLLPLGGYLKLLGESEDDVLSEADEQRSFLKQPVSKRIAIVIAGPLANFLLAILIFTVIYMIGIPTLTTQVGGVQPEFPAFNAGITEGDKIFAIDGKKITRWEEMAEVVAKSGGKELRITIKRGQQLKGITLKPKLLKVKNIFGEEVDAYKIGVSPSPHTVTERMNPFAAFWVSLKQTYLISKLTLIGIVKIIEGTISPKTLGGPILIAQIAGTQAKEGILPFVLFMALLSVNLAILNLLPIPVLDGGHILFYLIEIIARREVNIKFRERAQQIGIALLIILMLFVFIIDIERLNITMFDNIGKIFTRQ
ncbi:MAG: RIP metalloprotease RseP [Syntrophales bacterium]|nr:RIP metalloprotease RseP [Syntrophales bacterium]